MIKMSKSSKKSNNRILEISKELRDNYLEQKKLMDEYYELAGEGESSPVSFMRKKTLVPDSLCDLLEIEEGTKMSRIEITNELYAYIKNNDLIDSKNKEIKVTKKLKKALCLGNEKLTFYNIQSIIDQMCKK